MQYKYIASLLRMVQDPDLVCANSGVLAHSRPVRSGMMINCILVVCYFKSEEGNPPLFNLVHINGASKSMWKNFNLDTHLFDFEPLIPNDRFTFKDIGGEIPGYHCHHIDILGGNQLTDRLLHGSIIEKISQYRTNLPMDIITVSNNGAFQATIHPDRPPEIECISTQTKLIRNQFNTAAFRQR